MSEFIQSPEQANPKTVDVMEGQFEDLDNVVEKTHELFPQYMELRRKAQSIFARMQMMFGMGHGMSDMNFETFQRDAEDLQELYEQAVAIRASMAYDNLKTTCGIDGATTMDDALETQLDAAMQPFESDELGSIRGRLEEICVEISKQPIDMITGEERGAVGYYLIDRKGQIVPHFQKLEKDIKILEETEQTFRDMLAPSRAPEAERLLAFIGKLKAGLEQIRNVDPQAKEMRDWELQFKVNHDWRPLRLALALAGGVFSVMGLGLTIAGKGFSPATGLWMAVAVLSVRPDLLQGSDRAALKSIGGIDHKSMHYFLTEKDWRGEKGKQAFQEIQDAKMENTEVFNGLSTSGEVFDFQIDEFLGTKSGPASELLRSSKMSNEDRAKALKLFGNTYDAGQREMIEVALMWGEAAIVKTGV